MRSPLRSRTGTKSFRCALSPAIFLFAVACNERPADLREWRVSDHDHTDNPSAGQVQVDPADAGAPAVPGLDDVTIVAWTQNCTQCHGQLGRGDGPRGPMVKATNLSDADWQSRVTDEQIALSIKNGRGQMPAFNLPDGTINNLVKLVRMMNAAKLAALGAHGAQGAASAAPSGSAAPAPKPSGSAPAPKASAGVPAPKPSRTAISPPAPKSSGPTL